MNAGCSAAEWGFKLHTHLTLAHRRLYDAAPRRRSTSHMAALIDLLISTPAVSASAASRILEIKPYGPRTMLHDLEDRSLVREVTGRGAFRLYAAASLDLRGAKMCGSDLGDVILCGFSRHACVAEKRGLPGGRLCSWDMVIFFAS